MAGDRTNHNTAAMTDEEFENYLKSLGTGRSDVFVPPGRAAGREPPSPFELDEDPELERIREQLRATLAASREVLDSAEPVAAGVGQAAVAVAAATQASMPGGVVMTGGPGQPAPAAASNPLLPVMRQALGSLNQQMAAAARTPAPAAPGTGTGMPPAGGVPAVPPGMSAGPPPVPPGPPPVPGGTPPPPPPAQQTSAQAQRRQAAENTPLYRFGKELTEESHEAREAGAYGMAQLVGGLGNKLMLGARAMTGDPMAIGQLILSNAQNAASNFGNAGKQMFGAMSSDRAEDVMAGVTGAAKSFVDGVDDVLGGTGILKNTVGLLVQATGAFSTALGAVRQFSDNLHANNMKFSDVSSSMARVAAMQEVREIRLRQERGERRGASAEALAQSKNRLDRLLAPSEDAWAVTMNRVGTLLNNTTANILPGQEGSASTTLSIVGRMDAIGLALTPALERLADAFIAYSEKEEKKAMKDSDQAGLAQEMMHEAASREWIKAHGQPIPHVAVRPNNLG